jgi:hypothetical protein
VMGVVTPSWHEDMRVLTPSVITTQIRVP